MEKDSGFDARAVANELLDLGDRLSIRLSNLHLQKVIFFSHANYLKSFGRELILNKFEAWEHGPVVSELYHSLKESGDSPVTGRATRFDFHKKQFVEVRDSFSLAASTFLEEMLRFYGRMDPWRLVMLSHRKGGAWDQTIEQAEKRANFALQIKPEIITACLTRDCGVNLQ